MFENLLNQCFYESQKYQNLINDKMKKFVELNIERFREVQDFMFNKSERCKNV